MGLYVVANSDGNVISSTDGLNWTEAFDTGISIGKVAVGPNRIVYTRCDIEEDLNPQTGLYYTSNWNQIPNLAEGTNNYYFNEVHYLGEKYVAVGFTGLPRIPVHAYSEDGKNWTVLTADADFCNTLSSGNNFKLNDVGYNGTAYFMIGSIDGENLAGGFYTADLSQNLGESQWASIENFPVDANQLVYANYPEGGENFGAWSVFSDDQKTWWSTFNEDPTQSWNFISGWDLTSILEDNTGLNELNIAEATIGELDGYVTWMLSTSNGQIIWWPHAPAGPFLSVPSPYEATVESISSLNPLEVVLSGSSQPQNNEKITITGSIGLIDLNNNYFVESLGSNTYRLHSTKELNSTVDASGWSGAYQSESATAKLSRGAFIDALGYGNGNFFAGNNNEEVFVCSGYSEESLVWTKVDDKNNSFAYWNDVDYGDLNSCSTTYTYDLSPDNPETIPNYQYNGEGNMDTAIINEDGSRRSIQRTGYFDYLDSCGNRKVMRINDGDTITDAPEVPNIPSNPAGHPTFQ